MSFLCFINWVLNGTLSVDNNLVFLYVIWLKARQISKNFQLFQNTGQFSATTFKNGYEYKLFILPDSQLSWSSTSTPVNTSRGFCAVHRRRNQFF